MEIRRIKIFVYLIVLFLIPSFSSIYGATLSKPANNLGLLGYWSFNEGTSTQATDFSGRGNTGTLNTFSAPATISSGWGNGKFGKGLIFDGSSDYVDIGNPSQLRPTSNVITISTWVKPSNTGAGNGYIVSKENATVDYFLRQQGTSGAVRCSFEGVNAGDAPAGTLVNGEWAFIVCVFDGSNNIIYKNGVSILSGAAVTSTFSDNGDSVDIGRKGDGTTYFTGAIDEVRIYNRALSPGEVRRLYDSGVIKINTSQNNLIRNGLIGYWNMDSSYSRNSLVTDLSTSGNLLTQVGTPQKNIGKVGQSLNLDAVDDEIYCTDANCGGTTGGKLDMGTRDWTVMAWIKPEAGGTNCNIRGTVAGKIGDDETGWYIGIGGQYICAEIRGGAFISSTLDGSQVPLNEWSHIAVVFDRDGNMTRYLNGVQTGTQDNISANSADSIDHPHNFCIGARDGTGTCNERFFDGSVDEVRVYDRVLSVGEISTLYKSGESKINASQNNISGSSLNNGLVGIWSFNSKDLSDKVYDRSGNGNDGYVNGRATSTQKTIGKVGQALDFDGTADYVYLGTPASLFPTSAITISAWIRPDQLASASQIVSNDDALTISNQMRTQGTGLRCSISNTTSTQGSTLVVDEWAHVACVYDGANIINYINGINVGSTALTGSISYPNSNTEPWRIGRRGDAAPGYFNGRIDEVRIYDRALTDSEMKQLYLLGR